MYKIALLNLPVANLAVPTLALTQLRARVLRTLGERVSVDVHYLNHDFAHYLDLAAYRELNSFDHHPSGLAEWFFRQVAFPDVPDNSEEYFQRYYPQHKPHNRVIKAVVTEKRAGLEAHFHQMIDKYALDRVDMVGLTSMFTQNVACMAMARLIKERNPRVVVVMGGANCEAPMGRTIVDHVPAVDFVFSGPSLGSFPALVRSLLEGDLDGCHRIDGVLSRQNQVHAAGCGSGAEAPGSLPAVRPFGADLSINEPVELDYTSFLDAFEANFPELGQPALFFETSRGCWWGERAHCTFCGLNGSTIGYRAMEPALAFRVLDSLFQHSDRVSHLQSVDNILPREYLTNFLPYLDTPPTMDLFYEVKADLTEDDFRVLAAARVLMIQPGIEALNTSTLKLMRKGTSAFQNLQFLITAIRYGIHPLWNLLIGFPGEEMRVYEKYLADLPLLTHLPPPSGVYPVRFDRFSPYFAEAEAYGLDLHPLDWYEFTYPFPPDALRELAYYFADRNYAAAYAMNTARVIGKLREKVDRWAALWAQPERRPELRLRDRDGATVVYDSRTGTPVEHPVHDEARKLLEAIGTPKRLPALQKELEAIDVEAELEFLRERGLVFQEGDRVMSLVVPPPPTVRIPVMPTGLVAAEA